MPSWKDNLVPASFRGVPFFWDKTERKGGRRLAKFEFPGRDQPYIEDLGRRIREFPMTAYVLGDAYMSVRDQLEAALDAAGPGTLQHPYRGPLTVVVDSWSSSEAQAEGRMARFDIQFLLYAPLPAPRSAIDTSTAAQNAASNASSALATWFGTAFSLAGGSFVSVGASGLVAALASAAGTLVSNLGLSLPNLVNSVGAIDGAETSDLEAVASAVASLAEAGPGIATADLPALVASVFDSAVTAIVDAATAILAAAQSDPSSPTELSSSGTPLPPDPSYGLAAFGAYGAGLPSVPPAAIDATQQGTNQASFLSLVQGAAVIALAQLYAQTTFASSSDAEAARDQITGLIDVQLLAATDDDLAQAWTLLYGATAIDLTTRAKNLPNLVTFATAAPMPSLWLANRLYQDADRAAELVARNEAIHPAFMPPTIEALSS